MNTGDALVTSVLAVVAYHRFQELVISRRHERKLLSKGGVRAPKDAFVGFVAVHTAFFLALPLEWSAAPWSGIGWYTPVLLGLALAGSALRCWSAACLGDRYTVRVIRLPEAPLVVAGPYRWMRHPIYRSIAVEMFVLPLAFGAWMTALVLGGMNLWVLHKRIQREDAILGRELPSRHHARASP